MTDAEITQFRNDFDVIKVLTTKIKAINTKISQISRWDNDGSHAKAIKLLIEQRITHQATLTTFLNGKSYTEWLSMSTTLNGLFSRRKKARQTVNSLEQKITKLKF